MNYWPAHPQPQEDELLSSWLLRAARANGQKFFSLCYLLAPEVKSIHSNLDYTITKSILERFAKKLRTPNDTAFNTTLDSYIDYLFEAKKEKILRRNSILQVGISHNSKNRFSLQYCPACLHEKS